MDISYYENFEDLFAKNEGNYYYFSTKAPRSYTDVSYPDKAFIVFGREDKGLPEELLFQNKESCVRIPMTDGARSLNLSNSVAVAAYEILRQWNFPELKSNGNLTKYNWEDQT